MESILRLGVLTNNFLNSLCAHMLKYLAIICECFCKNIYKLHPGPTIKPSTQLHSTIDHEVALDLVQALTAVGQVYDLSISVYQLINA